MASQRLTSLELLRDIFILDCRARRLRQASLRFYTQQLTYFLDYANHAGAVSATDITSALVRGYLVHLQDRGLADASIQSAWRAVRAFCNFLVKDGVLAKAPDIATPKADKHAPDAFTQDEIRQLYNAADNARDRAILLCLLDTGCRASELLAWNVGDVDIYTGAIRVRVAKNRQDRTVYLGLAARRDYLRWYAELPSTAPDAPVWASQHTGERLTVSGLSQLLKRIGNAVDIKPCNAHKFRRTFALMSLRAGMDVYTLQRLMGHKTLEMLLRYLALTEADLGGAHGKHSPVDNYLR